MWIWISWLFRFLWAFPLVLLLFWLSIKLTRSVTQPLAHLKTATFASKPKQESVILHYFSSCFVRLVIDSRYWPWTLILSFAKPWPTHDPQRGFNLSLPLTMCPCLFCKVWMSESGRVRWLERALLLSVWVRVLLIIGLPSATSMYGPCTCLRPSCTQTVPAQTLTWLQPHQRHSSSNLSRPLSLCLSFQTLSVSVVLFTCLPVHVSTFHLSAACLLSLCIHPLQLSSMFPVQTYTNSWQEISSRFGCVTSCAVLN